MHIQLRIILFLLITIISLRYSITNDYIPVHGTRAVLKKKTIDWVSIVIRGKRMDIFFGKRGKSHSSLSHIKKRLEFSVPAIGTLR